MPNKLYDFLKWIALTALPAVEVFISGLWALYGWPNGHLVVGTIALVDGLLGALLGVSSLMYKAKNASESVGAEDE